jgi:hypothetical protein
MPSIHDIRHDTFYQQASYWTLLLYQLDNVGLDIPLSNAQLMSFFQVFQNRQTCRDYILQHNQRMVTLFAYSENVEKWWAAYNDDTPYNLQEIHIFCEAPKDITWMNIYTGRFKSLIKDIFVYDRLDDKVLYYAIRFIDNIQPEFQGDALNGLKVVRRRLCKALSNYFDEQSRL